MAIAPNLTVLVGELVGARLIAHAGSLVNLAKAPASTVQILGAEKALFRALKTKHEVSSPEAIPVIDLCIMPAACHLLVCSCISHACEVHIEWLTSRHAALMWALIRMRICMHQLCLLRHGCVCCRRPSMA